MGTHLTDFNYQRLALNSRTKMSILNFCLVLMLLLLTGIKIANSLPQYDYSYDYDESEVGQTTPPPPAQLAFSSTGGHINVKLGYNLLIYCNSNNDELLRTTGEGATLLWTKKDDTKNEERWRLLAIDDTTYARDPRISVYYKQQPNRQYMVIRDVQMSDQGVYKCELSRRPDPLSIITTVDVFEKMPEVYYYDYVEAERISRERERRRILSKAASIFMRMIVPIATI